MRRIITATIYLLGTSCSSNEPPSHVTHKIPNRLKDRLQQDEYFQDYHTRKQFADLQHWLRSNGGFVSNNVETRISADGIRGLYARRDIRKYDVLMRVPRNLLIWTNTRSAKPVPASSGDKYNVPNVDLCKASESLVRHMNRGNHSPFFPVMNAWLSGGDARIPHLWSRDERRLLAGTPADIFEHSEVFADVIDRCNNLQSYDEQMTNTALGIIQTRHVACGNNSQCLVPVLIWSIISILGQMRGLRYGRMIAR